jgi:hypothetical protein
VPDLKRSLKGRKARLRNPYRDFSSLKSPTRFHEEPKRRNAIASLMPMRSPTCDQRRVKPDVARHDCAADACMLAHGPHSKRVTHDARNRVKT